MTTTYDPERIRHHIRSKAIKHFALGLGRESHDMPPASAGAEQFRAEYDMLEQQVEQLLNGSIRRKEFA